MELILDEEENNNILFIYSDGWLSEKRGKRHSGFGTVGYNKGRKVFKRKGALGEHMEVYNVEMAGLCTATMEVRWFIKNKPMTNRPHKIVSYADNTGAINRIFKGSPGKAQAHSRGFRREVCDILNMNKEAIVAISWCPGHQGILGNKEADKLAKSGSKVCPEDLTTRHRLMLQHYINGKCKNYKDTDGWTPQTHPVHGSNLLTNSCQH